MRQFPLELPLEFVHNSRAIDVSSVADQGVYDICFLAVDPERAHTIDFTTSNIRIEGSYLAGPDCPAADAGDLVARGLKVGTVEGRAYTLDLSRKPGAVNLVYFSGIHQPLAALDRGEVSAVAGIRDVMAAESASRPGARVLDPPFMEIRQAMGMPVGWPIAAQFLREWVDDLAVSGRSGEILERHGVSADCAVRPD